MKNIPQFLIAAPTSGAGKTTVSRGLMALLVSMGKTVQPYKCGPDYIDTKYHTKVCGRSSVNLDTFMASEEHVREIYARYAKDADALVVEGMMGMYDGYERDKGSSAEIARLLDIPVVLVVDAKSAAYSMAPLLKGFMTFRDDVQIAGVIFNKVGSARHYAMLQEVCDDLGLTCFGYLPKQKELEQGSRYLGLDFSQAEGKEVLNQLVNTLKQHVDTKLLLKRVMRPMPKRVRKGVRKVGKWNILVANNEESFSFIYKEHLDILRSLGKVRTFNPELNKPLPKNIDLIYLPGGYPEKHAERLSKAQKTLDSLRDYVEAGGKVLAECGGLIYLSQGVVYDSSPTTFGIYPLAGIFNVYISMRRVDRKLSLGYRQLEYKGQTLKGHEFHYTQYMKQEGGDLLMPPSVAKVYDARGKLTPTPVFRYKNVIASYTHLYWGEADITQLFI